MSFSGFRTLPTTTSTRPKITKITSKMLAQSCEPCESDGRDSDASDASRTRVGGESVYTKELRESCEHGSDSDFTYIIEADAEPVSSNPCRGSGPPCRSWRVPVQEGHTMAPTATSFTSEQVANQAPPGFLYHFGQSVGTHSSLAW